MTRHDWIVLAGVMVSLVLSISVAMHYAGQIRENVSQTDRRVQRLEEKVDAIHQSVSRLEGYLESAGHVHSRSATTVFE